ncbi:hypothetical protein A2Z53_02995 [Candidatus Giovannonibacteria bacterium RIFCSPHIGHO2_02_42_15]|uniref:DUF2339 domain-containing protein n=2 Tax=Candidatus Giovannoniibacteriota TaxID=1752738 RepID=A0A1F5VNC3_9BACT|nr:MAG: hypothetical protein UV11_C0005G0023 [Candidatus Giovannonibacteria bacterium GW2011_GWF2_42_19]OGF64909.1 MAG: hypothetical protein A2Z53_02995 [Candidatus Giovannonibacteria bacterium RIFCSPHIGHO2_02_42_15]
MDENKRIEELEGRIANIEKVLNIGGRISQVSEGAPPPPPRYAQVSRVFPEAYKPAGTATPTSQTSKSSKGDVESYIGRWILGVVGVVAILFGASFFLKFAFDNNLIGPAGRVAMGIIAGLIFIFLGEYLRPRLQKYSFILSGGGLGLLYLSVYSAYWFYNFLSQPAALGFMSAITAFGIVLSIWADAMPVAAISIVGGFITPFLLSTGIANDAGFFTYLVILNLAVLIVSFFKKWHALTLLGFVFTIINFGSWFGSYYTSEKLFFSVWILSIFYVIYALVGVIANIATKKQADAGDLFILTINPAWYFGWLYFMLNFRYERSLGFVAAALGAFYVFLAYAASSLRKEDDKLVLFLGAIAVVFLTIAIPLELEQNAITIAWAVEAALLFALGVYLKNDGMRMFSLGVLIIAVLRLFGFDSRDFLYETFIIFFNKRFFTYLMVIFATAIMTYLSVLKAREFSKFEKGTQLFLATALNLLILIAVTSEISYFFNAKALRLSADLRAQQERLLSAYQPGGINPNAFNSYNSDYNSMQNEVYEQTRSITNQKNASISVFWTLYAILLITFGIAKKSSYLRWSALILFGITIIKVFLIDLTVLSTPLRILSFMVLGIILLAASYLYFRYRAQMQGSSN